MSGSIHKQFVLLTTVIIALLFEGCSSPNPGPDSPAYVFHKFKLPPRPRMGSYASSTIGTRFCDPDKLGRHSYYYSLTENNGIIYTCRAGHIDISHVRKSIDWTAYIAAKTYKKLMKNRSILTFKMLEDSIYHVYIHYPDYWPSLDKKTRDSMAFEISIEFARYAAFMGTTWHEILTWYGYKSTGIYSEYPSAFSWEDSYSNLLGVYIGARALRKAGGDFDRAATIALEKSLRNLGAQPAQTARAASEMVRGKWFRGDNLFFVEMLGRNFDIGLDDGYITPWRVTGIEQCSGADILPLSVPTLESSRENGFEIEFEIEPREWEASKILKAVYPDAYDRPKRIVPAIHFPVIIEQIKNNFPKKVLPLIGPLE